MSMKWAKIHTAPRVGGMVTAAKANGTPIATSVPNMNASTISAIGIAMDSPRFRSSL